MRTRLPQRRIAVEQIWPGDRVRAGSVTSNKDPIEIDFSVIEELAEGNPEVIAELAATFVRHTTDGIAKVRAAVDAGQHAQAALTAHTCVGFTATIGITGLVPVLRDLERAAKENRHDDLARLIVQWEQQFEEVRRALRARIKDRKTP